MSLGEISGADLRDAFAAGVYLLFGVIHLDLWLKRRDPPSHLWLAGAALGALIVDLTGMVLRESVITRGVIPALNLLGVILVTASLVELVFSLGRERTDRVTRFVVGVAVLLALVGALAGVNPVVALFFAVCGGLLLRALLHAIRSGRHGDPESRAIAAGLVVLLVALILDILSIMQVIGAIPGLPVVGFIVMFLVAAHALNGRYEREHAELETLRHDLEERVSLRTRELEDANRRLAEASRTDALTGLPNRRGFLDVADHELKRSDRSGEPLSLLMLDLDHFKGINDRYGHAAGDAVLQAAAALLRSVLRAQDLVARWGGEEFIVLLPATDGATAVLVAEKARHALAAFPFECNGSPETITSSFGVATHRRGQSIDVAIAAADRALYAAKEAGRDCVRREE